MKYENYTVLDFLDDEYFVSWVKDSNKSVDQFWEKWLQHNPQKAGDVQEARIIISNIEYQNNPRPGEKEMIDMFENIVRSRDNGKNHTVKRRIHLKGFLRYAAVVLVMLTVGFALWKNNKITQQNNPSTSLTMLEKFSPMGVKSTVWLHDGTKVRLNSGTKLTYPDTFALNERKVYLEGEAFFEVQRDEGKPFIVVARGVETKVLGTSFNLKAYPEQPEIKVGVVEGKVRVSWQGGTGMEVDHVLAPNQMSVINVKKREAYKGNFDPDSETAWKDWKLQFRKSSLKDIFSELERWYGVEIEVSHNIDLTNSYSGSFENETLKAVLIALADNAELNFDIKGKHVTISK